jgi:cellulose synthase/poly-beta-1,6-N-acetylglucosamine synthase-like glycosyltransferase
MPVYNGENYLAETVDSILAQTFADFELVISDNASTDATEAICRAYAARDRRIRYVRNPSNIGAARNSPPPSWSAASRSSTATPAWCSASRAIVRSTSAAKTTRSAP